MDIVKRIGWTLAAAMLALLLYAADGYRDALRDAPKLKLLAQSIIEDGRGPGSLTDWQVEAFLAVEDPSFFEHSGIDWSTPGAGAATISQSVSKRVAFKGGQPGIGKIRQTAYALGLEEKLDKEEILALFMDLTPMGAKDGLWITGVHTASEAFFEVPVSNLEPRDFLSLIAVMIAPGDLKIASPDAALQRRVLRIERLLRGDCIPTGNGDVWLEGCRVSS
ncbi:MAG: transglycosylase domain-containing protein [Pseudomonadota bacterium]